MSKGTINAEISPMDINANLHAMGRYGRIARISAIVCLLTACVLLLASLATPISAASIQF